MYMNLCGSLLVIEEYVRDLSVDYESVTLIEVPDVFLMTRRFTSVL